MAIDCRDIVSSLANACCQHNLKLSSLSELLHCCPIADLLLVWMSPSVSPSPSEPSPSCWAVVVLMAPVLELTLPGPAGWPSTAVSPYALLRPDTVHTNSHKNATKQTGNMKIYTKQVLWCCFKNKNEMSL